MKARIVMIVVALVLVLSSALEPNQRSSFVPGGGQFRGHGASSSW